MAENTGEEVCAAAFGAPTIAAEGSVDGRTYGPRAGSSNAIEHGQTSLQKSPAQCIKASSIGSTPAALDSHQRSTSFNAPCDMPVRPVAHPR